MKAAKLHAEPPFSPLEPFFLRQRLPIPRAFREQFVRVPGESFRIVLEGTMHRIWYRPRWLKPLFWALGQAGILVPHIASNVPTTLRVEPGRDRQGRPYHLHVRDFHFPRPLRFVSTTVQQAGPDRVADIVGPGGLVYIVSRVELRPPGTLVFQAERAALRIAGREFWLPDPLWPWLLGVVRFEQVADEQADDTVHIRLTVGHPLLGNIFGYHGTFRLRRIPADACGTI